MKFTENEMDVLVTNSLDLRNAKLLAELVESDYTVGGIFPKGAEGDFTNPNHDEFKRKFCPWWKLARILFNIAKIFTKKKGDKALDALILLGDTICV